MAAAANRRRITLPGVVLGIGLGGFLDGLFHVVIWLAVLIGLGLLYSRVTVSRGRAYAPTEAD